MNGGIERVKGAVGNPAGCIGIRQRRARRHQRAKPLLLQRCHDLAVDIPPFADSPEGKKALPAELFQLVHGSRPVGAVMDRLPDVENGDEVGQGIHKLPVGLVGQGLFLQGPLPNLLDAQGGGDDDDLPETTFLLRFDEHSGKPGIDRQPGHGAAVFRQLISHGGFPFFVHAPDGPQFHQQIESVPNASFRRPVNEWKIGDLSEFERNHPQDDLGQIGPEDFRLGEQGPV